ncbi:MAG: DUF4097 family beta strand repeat-containing protein [Bacillota bacterium]
MARKWAKVAAILMMATALTGCTVATDVVRAVQVVSRVFQTSEVVEQTHRVQPGSALQISNLNGDITVRAGGNREIHIVATKRAFGAESELGDADIRVAVGEITVIETVHRKERTRVSVDYEVTIPQDMILNEVRTSNGYVQVEGVTGDVVATSSNGSIHLEGVDGYVRATTSNGSIDIVDCTGVRSGVHTSNGSIRVEVRSIEGNLEIRTGNGSITAYLSRHLNAEVIMTVSNGQVVADHNHLVIGESSAKRITGQIGSEARHQIRIRTSNGTVTARKIEE